MKARRGYVLVTALALLVLSATLLVSMGRLSLDRTLQARQSQEELQRRWGQISSQRAILLHSEQILLQLEGRQQRPIAAHRASINLGGQNFELILSDEQAKANVNALLDLYDQPRTETQLRAALSGSGLSAQLKLRPMHKPITLPSSRPSILPRYVTGFGQIFSLSDSTAPQILLASHVSSPAPAQLITLWGDGRLNIRRASPAALSLLDSPPLTQIDVQRLIEARNKLYQPNARPDSPAATPGFDDPIRRLLSQAAIAPNKSNLNLRLGSACHSLWIIVRDGRREWYSFAVLDETDAARPRSESFVW